MKKFFAFLLSAVMLLGTVLPSFAADEPTLLTYQSETPEIFTKNGITIDPRDHTGDNPDLKLNVHYATPSWGEVLSLIPQSEGGAVQPQSYAVKFKIEEKDTYYFAFTIYETADAKAGTPRKIDLCLDGGQTYRIVEEAVKPGSYLLYDGLSAELEPGEHTITLTTCTGNGFQAAFSEIFIAGTTVTPPADEANIAEEEKIDTTVKGEHKMSNGETVKSLVGTASMPSVFTYADMLDLSAEMTAQKGSDKNKNLIEGTDYYIDTAFQNAACVIPRREGSTFTAWSEFAIEFEVTENGTYHFCIGAFIRGDDAWSNPDWKHASSVRIDDGEVFSVNEDDLTNLGKNKVNYFLGLSAELTAGTHTLYLIADKQIGLNAYFKSLHYYREGAEPTAPATPDTPVTPVTPVTPDPNAGKAPEGSMIYLPEMTETMAGGDIVTIDLRDCTGDNPNLVEGTDYTMLYTSNGGWGDIFCLKPASKDKPVTYNVKFTAEEAGKYEFSVAIWTSTDAKTSTPRKIDVFLDGGDKYRITETSEVAAGQTANFYGITATLAAGEHTFSFQTCTQNGLQCYLQTLSYSMTDSSSQFDPAIESTWGDTNIPEGDLVYVETKPVVVQIEDESAEDPDTDTPATDVPDTDAPDTDAPDTDAPDTGDTTAPDNKLNVTVIAIVIVAVVAVVAAVAVILAKKKKK